MVGKKGMNRKGAKERMEKYSIAVNAPNKTTYERRYSERFGSPKTTDELRSMDNAWKERTRIIKRYPELVKPKPSIPKTTTIHQSGNHTENIVDEETTYRATAINQRSEIILLLKEANKIRAAELELFQQLANHRSVNTK